MTLYYSTNHNVPEVDLAEALLQGQAGDKGLFLPKTIPVYSRDLIEKAKELSYPELATEVLWPYVEGVFAKETLRDICVDAYDYEVPLEKVDTRFVMRLDQGPTASFKDFAARFMGRAIGRLVKERNRELLILTATSGDTGSAVASAFQGVAGIKALVLFPISEVSDRQRKQMTSLSGNIATIAFPGKFDDCQALVKQAFSDKDLAGFNLSSANSINIGRLLPQSVYYLYAASRLADIANGEEVIFSIPSGNFGDMMGGVLAGLSGLPIKKFIIATNENDEVPKFLKTGKYDKIEPSRKCISNAMNVGHPSNLARLVHLYGGQMDELGNLNKPADMDKMRRDLYSVSISDEETRATIGSAWEQNKLMLEPHGAVGWAGLSRYLELHPQDKDVTSISLETAHPAKFPDEIRAITGIEPAIPNSLDGLDDLKENYDELPVDYEAFKRYLKDNYGK